MTVQSDKPPLLPWHWSSTYNLLGIAAILVIGLITLNAILSVNSDVPEALDLSIREIHPQEIPAEIEKYPNTILIDIRSVDAWQDAHIEGALSIPLAEFDQRIDRELTPDSNIILICENGTQDSRLAATWLLEHGYQNVSRMSGGFNAWRDGGYPMNNLIP